MLDLDNDLQWSSSHSYECESEKMNRVNEPLSIDAYLDFLEDLDAFQSVKAKRGPLCLDEVFEL